MRKLTILITSLVLGFALQNKIILSVSAQTPPPVSHSPAFSSPTIQIAPPLINLTPEQAAANPLLKARLSALFPEERNSVLVYETSNRGVVNINTKSQQADFFFRIESENGGSGVVFDKRGHIITNYHVVEDARKIQATLFNGNTYDAIPVGGDPATDLAVLKIDAPQSELFPVALGDSAQLLVGEKIYAIGNPFGLERTFTSGVISNLNRTIGSQQRGRTIKQVIQIDAAINHGSSGGALLNTAGQLIGINTAIASQSGDNAGVGFAIPVNTVARIVPMLVKDGKVIRPDIGIYRVLSGEEGGVYAVLIEQGGPADKAGVIGPMPIVEQVRSPGFFSERRSIKRAEPDLIIAVNNKPINSGEDFIMLVEENRPGDTIVLTVVRKGKQLNIPVTLK
ncbi:MAG: trypsin-like peptidase domain-containing protein [Planctomycetaceae bacterium]|nr:trypsin-like peptidase domain-containing protein [Planctomycetaceae bacterium]